MLAQTGPYHHMETAFRITTEAVIADRLEAPDTIHELLRITESATMGGRYATNYLGLWLGNMEDPASVVTVCDRLIDRLTAIRDHHAAHVAEAAA